MDLEHLVKIPYDNNSYFKFYEYENGGRGHTIEYEYFRIEGTNLVIVKKVPCSEKITQDKCEKGYQKWFS